MAKNNKTRFFYVLYSDKTRVFDQLECAYYPIYIINIYIYIYVYIYRKVRLMKPTHDSPLLRVSCFRSHQTVFNEENSYHLVHILLFLSPIIYSLALQTIICRARPYSNITKRCDLCTTEKVMIINSKPDELLNKRSELISKCRHENKFYLRNNWLSPL